MKAKDPGLRRYFYEYMFYRAIEMSPKWSNASRGADDPEVLPVTASQGRMARARLDEALAQRGLSMDEPGKVKLSDIMPAIDDALERTIPGHRRLFDATVAAGSIANSKAYLGLDQGFRALTGLPGKNGPAGDSFGARLPVSPYDPRWSQRETILSRGTALLAVPDAIMAGGYDISQLHQLAGRNVAFDLVTAYPPVDQEDLALAGGSNTLADQVGMSGLRGYMSSKEYRVAKEWMLRGAADDQGRIHPDALMKPELLTKTAAILDHLNDEGIEYEVLPDQKPGQLKARLRDSGMDIRLTDLAGEEAYVGRVYDSGAMMYYSTGAVGRRVAPPEVSIEETIKLIDFARGAQIERSDGELVGSLPADGGRNSRDSYYPDESRAMFKVSDKRFIRVDMGPKQAPHRFFADSTAAEAFLAESVSSARENYFDSLGAAELIELAHAHAGDDDFEPEFTGDDATIALKQDYWKILRGEDIDLLAPGYTMDDYEVARSVGDQDAMVRIGGAMDPTLSPENKVLVHARLATDSVVGTFEPDASGKRFDPVVVSLHMTGESGTYRNNADIIGALRRTDITADELRGDSFYSGVIADRLIKHDEATAVDIVGHSDPTLAGFGDIISETLETSGVTVDSIKIDDSGVVRWKGSRNFSGSGRSRSEVTGEIGQLYGRGQFGEIVTATGSGNDHMFVPGYVAVVAAQRPGETKTLEERTRLRGYEQVMGDALRAKVRSDAMFARRTEVGEPTSLNSVMRSLYDTRHPVDFFERTAEEGLSDADREAILRTEGLRVRYSNELRAGSTVMAHARAERSGFDERNDNNRDPLVLTGNRNMSVLDTDASAGIFDPIMTGMARNQGIVRYLVPSATIDENGFIIPGDPDDRVPVATMAASSEMGYDPHDRQNMTFSNIMQSSSIVSGAKVAMSQIHGWNFEDGMVISADFANANMIRDTEGAMRPLKIGDKLSDMHGNKGVVSLVVDPQMSDIAAEAEGLTGVVEIFRENPDLDVVMSPFSAISRFNGGTARELMATAEDLHMGDRVIEGGRGELNMIVTHMAVDAKTNVYDADAMAAGRGRKASSQLAWVLQSQGCTEIFADFYGPNAAGLGRAREYLVALGYDLRGDGSLAVGIDDIDSTDGFLPESRRVIPMPELVRNAPSKSDPLGRLNLKEMSRQFGLEISNSGGVMELPFPLTLASGTTTWNLPVLSSHLRSEQDIGDGTVVRHDYTRDYIGIAESAARWRDAKERGDEAGMFAAESAAAGHYASLSGDIIARRIEGKDNMFKESVMGRRVANSATAVWSGDPRLDVDQVAMNQEMAAELDPNGAGRVLVWRDPALRSGAARYLKIVINDDLSGVAVNPVSVKSMDGDFDGDSVGLVGNLSPKAHEEAMERLTVEANLLDRGLGVRDPATGEMTYPLSLHDSLDITVAAGVNPELGERMSTIVSEINDLDRDFRAGHIDREDFLDGSRVHMAELNEVYRESFAVDPKITLEFSDMDRHMKSVEQCHLIGGKGSPGKMADYGVYIGAAKDDSGQWKDTGKPSAADMAERYAGSQKATAIKTEYTGVAGKRSQTAIQLLRPQGLIEAACETGYPATQSTLQAKHDPIDAAYRADCLTGAVQDLWRGYKLESHIDPENGRYQWDRVYDRDAREFVRASRDEWIDQFNRMYCDDKGMGVSVGIDQIEKVASALSDEHGMMLPLEKESWDQWPEDKRPLALDQMAYGGDMDTLKELARSNARLFTGVNEAFAPAAVRVNMRNIDVGLDDPSAVADVEMVPVSSKDVRDLGDGPVRQIDHGMRVPKERSMSAVLASGHQTVMPDSKSVLEELALHEAAMAEKKAMAAIADQEMCQ